jgi:hypothetical protein
MPLILAIEPDRRQANQLTALVRGRLHADLVLGESADRALAALGDRVPDLILTAALLSPKDEAALGQRLRDLNGVAAHVQTLTIPVLASGKSRGDGLRTGGILSALRRDKPKSAAPDGCDPAVFAEQCKEYLERAASEQALHAGSPDADETTAIDASPAIEPATAIGAHAARAILESHAAPVVDDEIATFIEPEPAVIVEPDVAEPWIATADRSSSAADAAPSFESEAPAFVSEAAIAEPAQPSPRRRRQLDPLDSDGPASLVAALALLEAEEEAAREAITPPRDAHAEHSHERSHQPSAEMDLSALLDPNHGAAAPADAYSDRESSVEVYEIDDSALLQSGDALFEDAPQTAATETELYMPLPRAVMGAWPNIQPSSASIDSPAIDADRAGLATETRQDEHDAPQEWLDIIEALRRDAQLGPSHPAAENRRAEQNRVEQVEPTPARNSRDEIERAGSRAEATPPSPANPADADLSRKKRRRRGDAPAQDEWGFFDPDQCGFAALLEKLQEITEDESRAPRA